MDCLPLSLPHSALVASELFPPSISVLDQRGNKCVQWTVSVQLVPLCCACWCSATFLFCIAVFSFSLRSKGKGRGRTRSLVFSVSHSLDLTWTLWHLAARSAHSIAGILWRQSCRLLHDSWIGKQMNHFTDNWMHSNLLKAVVFEAEHQCFNSSNYAQFNQHTHGSHWSEHWMHSKKLGLKQSDLLKNGSAIISLPVRLPAMNACLISDCIRFDCRSDRRAQRLKSLTFSRQATGA